MKGIKIPGHGESRVEINFWFFLFVYYGFYNITALMWITMPDRRAETVSAWLQIHPSIAIVSRDGSSQYASAISKGAPQARQVSDRWHLVKILRPASRSNLLENLLDPSCRASQGQRLRRGKRRSSKATSHKDASRPTSPRGSSGRAESSLRAHDAATSTRHEEC